MILKYFSHKWKDGLDIGRNTDFHYLDRQRIATLNAICIVILFFVVLISVLYISLGFSNRFIPLIIVPFALITMRLNYTRNYIWAKNTLFFGALFCIAVWSFSDRRTGTELLFIVLAYGSVTIYKVRKYAYLSMIICSLMFLIYFYYDINTPFNVNKNINYDLIQLILTFSTAGIIFFQAVINSDISLSISAELDKNLEILNESLKEQQISDEKLRIVNNELSKFNEKLDLKVTEAVKELQYFQNAINDNLNSIVTAYDGTILQINDLYIANTGFTREELVGQNINILKSDFHSEAFYKNINDTLEAGKVWRGESKIKTKKGKNLWLVSSILPIKDELGNIEKFLTISADITEKKEVQEKEKLATKKLTSTEKRLGIILENQTDLIVISDKYGNRSYVNQSFCDFFGRNKEFYIGTNYRTLDADNVDQFYLQLFDSISYENPKITVTIVRENISGEKRWIRWTEIGFFNADKEITEILSIGHDVTDIKENEFQNANYIAQFEELAFKNSHQLRKPLSNILGIINLVDNESTLAEVNELLDIVKNEVVDLDSYSQELSNFININSKNNLPKRDNFNNDFINAKLMHLKWKYKILHFINGASSLTNNQAFTSTVSDFGKWYYNEGKAKYGHIKPFKKLEVYIERIHKNVLDINLRQQNTEKYNDLFNLLQRNSDKIIILIDEAEQFVLKQEEKVM